MKSMFLGKCLVLLAATSMQFVVIADSANAMSVGTPSTTTTTPTGFGEQNITGMLPTGSSGLSFSCDSIIAGGAITSSVLSVPTTFINTFTSGVFSIVGMSMGVSRLVNKVKSLIERKASSFCSQVVPRLANNSGDTANAMAGMSSIVGANSTYVADLNAVATQMQTLTASITPGMSTADGQALLDDFNALQQDQLDILQDMDDDMEDLTDTYADAAASGSAPGGAVLTGALPNCTEVIFVDPLNPTPAESADAATYQFCQPSATGVCCVRNCDGTVNVAVPGAPTDPESVQLESYPGGCFASDASGASYCCFN